MEQLSTYKFNRFTLGAKCSSQCANYSLQRTAIDEVKLHLKQLRTGHWNALKTFSLKFKKLREALTN